MTMLRPLKVLVLEDVESDAELMVHELKHEGFLPDWRRVDTENLYLAALEPGLDLILADYNLPQFDAFRALQLMQEQKLDIPFIVVSGNITEDAAVTFLKQGASDYLLKDRMARLGQAVVKALDQKELREEKKRTDAALRASEERFRSLFENSQDALMTLVPPSWKFTTGNKATVKMFGAKDKAEFISLSLGDVSLEYQSNGQLSTDYSQELCEKAILDGSLFFEWTFKKLGGETFPCTVLLTRMELLGETIFHATVRDISVQKKAEEELHLAQNNLEKKVHERTIELKERYDEIEQLVYAISHDLILPLVTIKGFLGYLKKDVASGSRQRIEIDLGLVGDAVERMEVLLVRALDVSSTGKLSNTREKVLYGDIVQEALSLAADRIRSSGARITVANDFPMVNVDRPRIVDVLVNLIENSIRYAGNIRPQQIEIGYQAKEGKTVFFVKDDGLGIDPIMQKNIFRLFYQGSEAENSNAGLALSRRIIEVHGGRMWIESVVNKGCAVYFTLPFI